MLKNIKTNQPIKKQARKKKQARNFSGGPVDITLYSQCRGGRGLNLGQITISHMQQLSRVKPNKCVFFFLKAKISTDISQKNIKISKKHMKR